MEEDGYVRHAFAHRERAEERIERVEIERTARESFGFGERPSRTDWLGIRLTDDDSSLADRYGLRLIEPVQIERMERMIDELGRMAERIASSDWRSELAERREPSLLSCQIGPAIGPGPAVSLDGHNNLSTQLWMLPKALPGWSPELSFGSETGPTGQKEVTLSADIGFNAPWGLARIAGGVTANLDRADGAGVYVQGRVLGLTCKIGADARAAANAWDHSVEAGVEWMNDALRRVGYPPAY